MDIFYEISISEISKQNFQLEGTKYRSNPKLLVRNIAELCGKCCNKIKEKWRYKPYT